MMLYEPKDYAEMLRSLSRGRCPNGLHGMNLVSITPMPSFFALLYYCGTCNQACIVALDKPTALVVPPEIQPKGRA